MHSISRTPRHSLSLFLIFLLLPIYWLVNMSFKTNEEIVSTMTLWAAISRPSPITCGSSTDESWYSGYINSLKYVVINTVISISVALPAALRVFRAIASSATSICSSGCCRTGWRRPRSMRLPFFNSVLGNQSVSIRHGRWPWHIASSNVPLAVWILEGFVSGVPRENRRDCIFWMAISFSAILHQDIGAADRQRHRGRGVLSASCFSLGRIVAGAPH